MCEITVGSSEIHLQNIVEYQTEIMNDEVGKLENNLILKANNDSYVDSKATIEVIRGGPLTKQSIVNDFDNITGIIEWKSNLTIIKSC
ncbi:MAG TPA: hypothetical protein VK093_00205 [Candidatus Avipropionibacterium sp.]|nr:hypothetical protein [Candidatus Avipropionibacterium sp.]